MPFGLRTENRSNKAEESIGPLMQIGLNLYKYVMSLGVKMNVGFLLFEKKKKVALKMKMTTYFCLFTHFKCNCSEDAFSQDACFISNYQKKNDYCHLLLSSTVHFLCLVETSCT